LIFPYPREHVHDEAVDTNHPKLRVEPSGEVCGGAWDLILY
jgi:preprotein translocase subunit SecB